MTDSTTSVAKKIPEGMELVDASKYDIPVLEHIEASGVENWLLGGPGLTADLMGIEATPKTGKLYYIYCKDVAKLKEYFDALDQWEEKDPRETFDALYTNERFLVGILNPETRTPKGFRMENLRATTHSGLARRSVGGDSSTIQVLKPKEFPETVNWSKLVKRYRLQGPFFTYAQITSKALARMGVSLDEKLLRDVFEYRCALRYEEPTIQMWQAFRKEYPTERVTQIT